MDSVMGARRRLLMIQTQDKNLFNVFAPFANPSDTTGLNTTKRIFTPKTYCLGVSYSNWFVPNNVSNFEVFSDGSMTVTCRSGYGVGYAFKVVGGATYLLDYTKTNGLVNRCVYASDGTPITNDATGFDGSRPMIMKDNADILVIIFRSNVAANPAMYSDITLKRIS